MQNQQQNNKHTISVRDYVLRKGEIW